MAGEIQRVRSLNCSGVEVGWGLGVGDGRSVAVGSAVGVVEAAGVVLAVGAIVGVFKEPEEQAESRKRRISRWENQGVW